MSPIPGVSRIHNKREDPRADLPYEDYYDMEFRTPEEQYKEAGPDARVYRLYMKEAEAFDRFFMEENKDGVDVILVFAGLFSAVVTTFLLQASLSLQPDQTQLSSLLLYELVQIAQGGSIANVTLSPLNPNTQFTPDTISVWVNGLWACSLVASLCVALFAVLVKQWLYRYDSFSSGNARYRSHRRQYRYLGFEKWGVTTITGLLPIIMHASLALFLIGLVLFYIPLAHPIAVAIAVIAAFAFLLYFTSNVLPIFNPQCPYQTPLTQFLCFVISATHAGIDQIRNCRCKIRRFFGDFSFYYSLYRPVVSFVTGCRSVWHSLLQRFICFGKASKDLVMSPRQWDIRLICSRTFIVLPRQIFDVWSRLQRSSSWDSFVKPMNEREENEIQNRRDELAVETLYWLFTTSTSAKVHSIVVQAFGGLNPDSRKRLVDRFKPEWHNVCAVQDNVFRRYIQERTSVEVGRRQDLMTSNLEAILRSFVIFRHRVPQEQTIDVSNIKPNIVLSMCASLLYTKQDHLLEISDGTNTLLSKLVEDTSLMLYPSQWEYVLAALCEGPCSEMQPSPVFLLIMSALSGRLHSPDRSQKATQLVGVVTFVEKCDDSLLVPLQESMNVFVRAQSTVSPVPRFLGTELARTAKKITFFALDSLHHDSSTDAANRGTYLKLLRDSLRFLTLDLPEPARVDDMLESFPSLSTALIHHARLMETGEDPDSTEVRSQIRLCFLDLCKSVLKVAHENSTWAIPFASPLSPCSINMISSFARLSIFESDPPLRRMTYWEESVNRATSVMSFALGCGSEDALVTFVREDWVQFLCGWRWLTEDALPNYSVDLLDAFTKGLEIYTVTDAHTDANDYIFSYIYQGNNLLSFILMLGIDPTPSYEEDRILRIERLVSLHPDRVEWDDVLRMLKKILTWRKAVPDYDSCTDEKFLETFPLKEYLTVLGEQSQTPSRTYHKDGRNIERQSLVVCLPKILYGERLNRHIRHIIKTIEYRRGQGRQSRYVPDPQRRRIWVDFVESGRLRVRAS